MQPRQRISPVLVGRDNVLALGARRAEAAANGRGHLLFLAGEAGIGKTRLLRAIIHQAEQAGLRAVSAAAFPRDLEISGAMLLDLGDQLSRSADPDWRARGEALLERVARADDGGHGDRHRRRRLLVLDVVGLIDGLAEQTPLAIGLEDLHWTDDLTLEVIAQLARRLPERQLLIVGTYRSDELYPRVPTREWRSRLLGQRLAEEVRVGRLDRSQTQQMAALMIADDVALPTRLLDLLHQRSDGIPLHIEELLGAAAETDPEAPAADSGMPDTLGDAILARAALLSKTAQRVGGAAAVIGRTFDLGLLTAVDGGSHATVGRALAELRERFFIVDSGAGWFDFRHALIRDALEGALDPARRRTLHRRVAEAAATRLELASHAFLSSHYELAGMTGRAFFHARLAAARAASMSSHREAVDLARRALRTAPPDMPGLERAALLRLAAAEEAATDDNAAAAASLDEERSILRQVGDHVTAAEAVTALVAVRHLLGDGLQKRVALISAELEHLDQVATRPVEGTRARLLAAMSAAYMLDRRLDEAISYGQQALELATRDGDMATQLNVAATLGSCMIFAGQMVEGWPKLERAVTDARRGRREAEAARAYRMIGTSASMLVEYERAQHWLGEGIDYAERTEQWNHRHYMAAHLGHVAWATGDWQAAEQLAEQALADGRGGVTTLITALHVRGYLAMGRGDWPRVTAALAEARQLGEEMQELQRFSPALWGLAEVALLSGEAQTAVALTEQGHAASATVRDAAYLFPFLVTGTRARLAINDPAAAERWVDQVGGALLERSVPGTLPAVEHARGLLALATNSTARAREHLAAARDGWLERRRWWEGQWAGIDLARCQFQLNRLAEAARLLAQVSNAAGSVGARPLLDAARELDGRIRARHPIESGWAPLTARELEVARLIAQGMTNRQIADELGIAVKTVSAHVEHILGRLGVLRRAEIAAWIAARDSGGVKLRE